MKRFVWVPVVLGLLCACGSSHAAAPQTPKGATAAKGPTGRNVSQYVAPSVVSTPRTKAAALRDAQRFLAAFRPPAGAVRLTAVPKGDRSPPGVAAGILGALVERHRLWLVHLPTKYFVRYFFHRLHGWHAIAYGTTRACAHCAVTNTGVLYGEVGFGGRATGRVLNLAAVKSHRAGWTLLRADVVVAWHLSAAQREDLPAGIREIDVRGPNGSARVTGRDQITKIVRWFGHLELDESPFCGGLGLAPTANLSLTFAFQGRHGTVATASVPDYSGSSCSTATYTIHGKVQTPLMAGDLDSRVQKLLGRKLLP